MTMDVFERIVVGFLTVIPFLAVGAAVFACLLGLYFRGYNDGERAARAKQTKGSQS
jgi:hypothetical protein